MSYVVAICDPCQSVTLASAPGLRSRLRSCEICQEPLRVVPGRVYHDNERTIFHLLSAAIWAGSLSSVEARGLSRLVTNAIVDRTFTACWAALTHRLPALVSWERVLDNDARAHENVLQLVRTILEALSTCRSSGVVPADVPGLAATSHPPPGGTKKIGS